MNGDPPAALSPQAGYLADVTQPHGYTVLSLGDSTGVGVGAESGGGYPQRLLRRLAGVHPGARLVMLAQSGAIYGWENTPNQTLPKRLPQQSPIEGLLLAGHWTNPGTGSVRCLLSGLSAAATVG